MSLEVPRQGFPVEDVQQDDDEDGDTDLGGNREVRRQAVDDELPEQQHRPEFQAVDERPQVQLVLKVDPSRHPIFVTDAEKLRSEGPLAMSPTPRPADKKPTARARGQRRPTPTFFFVGVACGDPLFEERR